jgi:hypothetical protein
MRLFDGQEKTNVLDGLIEVFLEFLPPGDFPADEEGGGRSQKGGGDGAATQDERAGDLWIHDGRSERFFGFVGLTGKRLAIKAGAGAWDKIGGGEAFRA